MIELTWNLEGSCFENMSPEDMAHTLESIADDLREGITSNYHRDLYGKIFLNWSWKRR